MLQLKTRRTAAAELRGGSAYKEIGGGGGREEDGKSAAELYKERWRRKKVKG